MTTIVLLGTLDTKGDEYRFLRDRLYAEGVETLLIDTGILGEPLLAPDITRAEVARAAGAEIAALTTAGRAEAIVTMASGATDIVGKLFAQGRLDGILALGGSGGAVIASAAMRGLPVGVPKLLVSTLAAGDTRPYVGDVDLTMIYPVVDIAGLNRISTLILGNAAAAIAGMARAQVTKLAGSGSKPLVGATMFGVTTPCVTTARAALEARGYEVLVFHATGVGGRSMERLIGDGYFAGILDVTTTELADELVGGILSAGPDRLRAAGAAGIPQVVSLGALDMVNFGPEETVPAHFRERTLHRHNRAVTLMRTTPEEAADLGGMVAERLNAATGPVALYVPLRGSSAIAVSGGAFYDPDADRALLSALREKLRPEIELHEMDTHINDPAFAQAMADRLHELIRDAGVTPP